MDCQCDGHQFGPGPAIWIVANVVISWVWLVAVVVISWVQVLSPV